MLSADSLLSGLLGVVFGCFISGALDSYKQQRRELFNTIVLLHKIADIAATIATYKIVIEKHELVINRIINSQPARLIELTMPDPFEDSGIPQIDVDKDYSITSHTPSIAGHIYTFNLTLRELANRVKGQQELFRILSQNRDIYVEGVVSIPVSKEVLLKSILMLNQYDNNARFLIHKLIQSMLDTFNTATAVNIYYLRSLKNCRIIARNLLEKFKGHTLDFSSN